MKKLVESLEEFSREYASRALAKCVICSLAPAVRSEIEHCRREDPAKYTKPILAEWINRNFDIKSKVTVSKLTTHFGKHVNAN